MSRTKMRTRIAGFLIALVVALALAPAPAGAVDIYVSPAGADDNPGTRERPFATLERARDALRELRRTAGWPRTPVTVQVQAGAYVLAAPLVLTPEDSGTADAPVIFVGEPGRTRISAGRRIGGWRLVEEGLWTASAGGGRSRGTF